jgi:integrase
MEHLTKPQLLKVLGIAREHSELHWLAILVGYNHALRASEICGQMLSDIRPKPGNPKWQPHPGILPEDVRDGYLTVQRMKGSLKTTQALIGHQTNPLLNERAALERLARMTEPKARVFPISRVHLYRMFVKYAQLAGIPEHLQYTHVLKHSTGMALIPKGIEFCRQYLGHRSVASTTAYIVVSDSEACDAARDVL